MLILSIYQLILFIICFLVFASSVPQIYAENSLLINEVLVHPSEGKKEWVEFYNSEKIDITSYWIDDDMSFSEDVGNSGKKSLADVQTGYNEQYPFIELSSLFNNAGDAIVLFDNSGNIIDSHTYNDDPGTDKTLGRVDSSEGLQVLAQLTKGEKNGGAQPTSTPTPLPTDKPTKMPTSTKTPTATKTLTSKNTNDDDTSPLVNYPSQIKKVAGKTSRPAKTKTASMSGIPTSILGVSSKSAEKKKKTTNKKTLVKESSVSQFPKHAIFISIGGIFLVVCGILVYLRVRRKNL